MRHFLIEVGTEEIPAFEIEEIEKQFSENLIRLLKDEGFNFSDFRTFSTPRRFAVLIYNLSERGKDKVIEKIGPPYEVAFKEGRPTQSAIGFAKSINLSVEDLYKVEKNGKFYVAGKQIIKGKTINQVISENFENIIRNIKVKKLMFWLENNNFKFIRPIRWILCLYGDEVISFEFLNIKSSNYTYGHRILSSGKIEIKNANDYENVLKQNFVIVDSKSRYEMILKLIEDIKPLKAYFDEELYREINGLVEYPFLAICEFDEHYLELPEKIIITAMKAHQRYIALFESHKLTNKFAVISNNKVNDEMKENFARVLKARLEDAKFYFENDLKKSLSSYIEDLKQIQFLESLTIYDKVQNVLKRAENFYKLYPYFDLDILKEAIKFYKIDLASSMIRDGKEFTSLEGYIASEYVKRLFKNEYANKISQIIYDWTLIDDPKTIEGKLLAIIDRFDTIVSILNTGYGMKGSYDPLGLKKITYEVFKVIIENSLDLNFIEAFELNDEQINFIYQRLENYLIEKIGFDHDLVSAVISIRLDNINEVYRRVLFLSEIKKSEFNKFSDIVIAQKRAYHIIKNYSFENYSLNPELFETFYESELYNSIKENEHIVDECLKKRHYKEVFDILITIKENIDKFFDNVFVMVENDRIRNNRLCLLRKVKNLYDKLADFSKIAI